MSVILLENILEQLGSSNLLLETVKIESLTTSTSVCLLAAFITALGRMISKFILHLVKLQNLLCTMFLMSDGAGDPVGLLLPGSVCLCSRTALALHPQITCIDLVVPV